MAKQIPLAVAIKRHLHAENERLCRENKRLREEIEQHKRDYECFPKKPQFYTCSKCGGKTDDLACCMYDDEEGGGE